MDLGDRALLQHRTWTWLRRRILGLLEVRSRTLWEYHGKEWQEKMAEAAGKGVHPLPWL